MAEEAEDIVEEDDADTSDDTGGKRKKLILFIVIPVLLLIGGGVGVAVMLGLFSSKPPANPDEEQVQVEEVMAPTVQTTFFEIPDLIVNLNTSGRKSVFLKIKILQNR